MIIRTLNKLLGKLGVVLVTHDDMKHYIACRNTVDSVMFTNPQLKKKLERMYRKEHELVLRFYHKG